MNNFWKKLNKPIICSAPMSGITNSVFRLILAQYGKPDVMFTEFVSCAGLCSNGKEKLLKQLKYSESERPIVAQLFGSNPEDFYISAKICKNLGFDGIDINMGCPDKSVIKQLSGSHLIKNPRLVSKIIQATKKGAGDLPVSVKTRLGYTDISEAIKWATHLLNQPISALSIHGRTKKQGYGGMVNWGKIEKIKKLALKINPEITIIGNGNISSIKEAEAKAKQYNLDGIMIGRGVLSDPLMFNKNKSINDLTLAERKELLLKHINLFNKIDGSDRNFSEIKKFYKAYISGFSGASKFRLELMKANNTKELKQYIKKIKNKTFTSSPF